MTAFSQGAIDKYFSEYEEDEKFSVVYVSPKMFKMVSKVLSEQENQDLKDVVENLDGLKILKVADKGGAFFKEAKGKIKSDEYELLMTARDEGQKIEFLTQESGDIIKELILLVGGDEFVLMSFMGDIDLEKIAKLAKSLNIDGAEHLDMLDKK
jgi:hypothetical protein